MKNLFMLCLKQEGISLKLQEGRFRLDMREKFFTEQVTGIGTGCPGRRSHCTCRFLRKDWMWHSECHGLLEPVVFGCWLDSMTSEDLSSPNASVMM